MTLVIDASVAIKWVVMESGHSFARELLDGRDELHAPDLVLVETANVLWKKMRRKEINFDHASAAIDALPRLFDSLSAPGPLLARAMELSAEMDHPIYDCLYLACAENLRATFVTADDRLVAKVRAGSQRVGIRALSEFGAPGA
jgi:predicted nucleic acid-binding protein